MPCSGSVCIMTVHWDGIKADEVRYAGAVDAGSLSSVNGCDAARSALNGRHATYGRNMTLSPHTTSCVLRLQCGHHWLAMAEQSVTSRQNRLQSADLGLGTPSMRNEAMRHCGFPLPLTMAGNDGKLKRTGPHQDVSPRLSSGSRSIKSITRPPVIADSAASAKLPISNEDPQRGPPRGGIMPEDAADVGCKARHGVIASSSLSKFDDDVVEKRKGQADAGLFSPHAHRDLLIG